MTILIQSGTQAVEDLRFRDDVPKSSLSFTRQSATDPFSHYDAESIIVAKKCGKRRDFGAVAAGLRVVFRLDLATFGSGADS